MIGQLTGRLSVVDDDWVVLDVGGVGYQLRATQELRALHGQDDVTAFVEMVIRDEQIVLYGFLQTEERFVFRLLVTVQGVGSHLALRILSSLGLRTVVRALQESHEAVFCSVSGVGERVARRLCHELHKRVSALHLTARAGVEGNENKSMHLDALAALEGLGYKRTEALSALERIETQESLALTLRAALRVLAQ